MTASVFDGDYVKLLYKMRPVFLPKVM